MTLENAHEVLGDIERLKAKEKNGGLTRDEQIDLHHAENLLARAQVTNLEAKQNDLGKLDTPRDLHSTELDALAKAKAVLARPWPGTAPASTSTQSSRGSLPPGDTATTSGVTPPAGIATSGHTGTGDTPGTTATGTTTSTASSGGTLTPATGSGSGTHTTSGVTAPEIGHGKLIPEDTTHSEHIDLARRRAENLEVIADKRPLNRHEQEVYDNARRVRDRNAPAQPGDRSSPSPSAGSRNTGDPDHLAMSGDEDALVPVTPDEDATLNAEADTPPADVHAQGPDARGGTIDAPPTAQATLPSSSTRATAQAKPSATPHTAPPGSPPPRGNPPPATRNQQGAQSPGNEPNNTGAGNLPQKKNKKKSGPEKPKLPDKTAYSAVFEIYLDPKDYGTSDDIHFNRANEALHKAILADPEFAAMMEKLIPGVTEMVSSKGGRENPDGYTWHHESTPGLMRLVPRDQHTSGSTFWNALHPDPKRRGGYALWAIPAGAVERKKKKKKK